MIITVCYMIIYILEAGIFWQYCQNLFVSRHSKSTEVLTLLFLYFVLFLGSLLESVWINLPLFLVTTLVYLLFMYKIKILTAFFHAFLITMIMVLSELGFLSILSYFAPDFYDNQTYLRNIIILSTTSKLLYFLILQFVSLHMRKRNSHKFSADKTALFLSIIPLISGFISLVLASVCMNIHLSLFLDIMITVSALLLLAANIFLAWFYAYIQERNQKFVEMQIQLQKEYDTNKYYSALNKEEQQQKILIHDFRKHLTSIANLNQQGNTEKISSYINELIQSTNLQDSIRICDNDLLNSIVFRYKQQCNSLGISFSTDIRSKCIDFLSDYNITALFSNLLDNAIEAAKETTNATIELSIFPHNSESNLTIITLINSCQKDPFSIHGHQLISKKKDSLQHGYGIKSIQRVAKTHGGNSQFYYDPDTCTFHSIIMLNKNFKSLLSS